MYLAWCWAVINEMKWNEMKQNENENENEIVRPMSEWNDEL